MLLSKKIFKTRSKKDEINKTYQKALEFLSDLLSEALEYNLYGGKDKITKLLSLYEGNIWNIIKRYHKELYSYALSSESSSRSESPMKRINDFDDNFLFEVQKEPDAEDPSKLSKPKSIKRKGTYTNFRK